LLDADQIECVKTAFRIIVDKQINIAAGADFVLCNRPEQIEGCRAHRPYGIGLALQIVDCFSLVHRALSSRRCRLEPTGPALASSMTIAGKSGT
jgi:hypothetical protein